MAEEKNGGGGTPPDKTLAKQILDFLVNNSLPLLGTSAGVAAAVSFEQSYLEPFGFDLAAMATFGDAPGLILRNTASFLLFGFIAATIAAFTVAVIAIFAITIPWLGETIFPRIGGGWTIFVVVFAFLATAVSFVVHPSPWYVPPLLLLLSAFAWLVHETNPTEVNAGNGKKEVQAEEQAHDVRQDTLPEAPKGDAPAADRKIAAKQTGVFRASFQWLSNRTRDLASHIGKSLTAAALRADGKSEELKGATAKAQKGIGKFLGLSLGYRVSLAFLIGVLAWVGGGYVIKKNSESILCRAKADEKNCPDDFAAKTVRIFPLPLLRAAAAYSVAFKHDAKGYDKIGIKGKDVRDCPSNSAFENGQCIVVANGVSIPLLFLGEYGGKSLFRSLGAGGGKLVFPTSDISFMAERELAPSKTADGATGAGWLRNAARAIAAAVSVFAPSKGETRTIIAIERERAALARSVEDLTASMKGVAKVLGAANEEKATEPKKTQNEAGRRYASLGGLIASDAPPPADGDSHREPETILDALVGLGDGVSALRQRAEEIRDGLKDVRVTNPVAVENPHLGALPEIRNGLKDVRVTNNVAVDNADFDQLPAIAASASTAAAALADNPGDPLALDGHIARRLDAIHQAISLIDIHVAGPVTEPSLPATWLGIPPRIAVLCVEGEAPEWQVGERIGFPVRAVAPAQSEITAKLPAVVDAIWERAIAKRGQNWAILVQGSADSRGTAMANLTVAERRAAHVQDILQREIERRSRRDGANSPLDPGQRNWEIVSYGIGEQFGNDPDAGDGDAASPRYVKVMMCEKASRARLAAIGN